MKAVRVSIIIASAAVLCCGLSAFAQTCDSPRKGVRRTVQNVQCEPVQSPAVCPLNCQCQGFAGNVCQCQQPCVCQQPGFIPQLRQSFQPTYQPYFGVQPLVNPRSPYAPHAVFAAANAGYYQAETAYPKGGTVFPGLQRILYPDQLFMTTVKPAQPLPTYTTRSPRDFLLNDNPSSIGY